MLNKKGVVGFILSLVLLFSLCNIANAVEMGMDKDKAFKELLKINSPKTTRIYDRDRSEASGLLGSGLLELERIFPDGNDKKGAIGASIERYFYTNKKIDHSIKYYHDDGDSHDQLLSSMIKVYGKPTADYYNNVKNEKEYELNEFSSLSKKEQKKILNNIDWERRSLWETKKEYIVLLTYDKRTYVMRFWRNKCKEWPYSFRVFTKN